MELEEQDGADCGGEGDKMGGTEQTRGAQRAVQGFGGQPEAWQIPGMMDAHRTAGTRLGMDTQRAIRAVCGLKVRPGCVC